MSMSVLQIHFFAAKRGPELAVKRPDYELKSAPKLSPALGSRGRAGLGKHLVPLAPGTKRSLSTVGIRHIYFKVFPVCLSFLF